MSQQGVESVERALRILDCFENDRPQLSLTELSRFTGFYKSTVLRLCASLERCGYLSRSAEGLFSLGSSLLRLGHVVQQGVDIEAQLRPQLKRLVRATGETASFSVRENRSRVCLFQHVAPHPIRFQLEEGSRLPLDHSAEAQTIAAFEGKKGEVYDRIRKQRMFIALPDKSTVLVTVAVPVFDRFDEFRGVLSVSGIKDRFDQGAREVALAELWRSAAELAARL